MTLGSDVPARKTVLVLAYSISPVRGSEYAVGWDHVTHMAEDHDLIVLYGLAGDHMGDIEEIGDAERAAFGSRVTFVPVLPDLPARILNAPNRAGRLVYLFYLAYRFWHRKAWREAQRICRERDVDLVHYLCPIGFREPGYLWRLDKPYVWGPVGGMPPYKWRLFAHAGKGAAMRAFLRNIPNWVQLHCSPRLRKALRRADVLVAATSENASQMHRLAPVSPIFLPENGIRTIHPAQDHREAEGPLQLIWVGRIDAGKALSFLLRALARTGRADWHLDVVGKGPLAEPMRMLAEELGISDRIAWHGHMPRQAAQDMFARSDIHVLSSLAEAHSTVLWEAMAHGVPTIAFDHCGMHDSICDDCGVRVPMGDIEQMVAGLAEAIGRLAGNRRRVAELKAGAWHCARRNSWDTRRRTWNALYDLAIERYSARRRVR